MEPLEADTNVNDWVRDNVPVLSPDNVSVTLIDAISIFPVFEIVIV